MTHGVIARDIMPARDGYLYPSLAALNVDIWLRYQESPPPSPYVRHAVAMPRFRMSTQADSEAFWRKTGIFRQIRVARDRTTDLTFEVDHPDAIPWTISHWAEKWRDHPSEETHTASDLLLASEYNQKRGKLHAFVLRDGGAPVRSARRSLSIVTR